MMAGSRLFSGRGRERRRKGGKVGEGRGRGFDGGVGGGLGGRIWVIKLEVGFLFGARAVTAVGRGGGGMHTSRDWHF